MLQTGQRIGSSAGIAVTGSVFYSAIAAGHGDFASAFRQGLVVIAAFIAAALALALADALTGSGGDPASGAPEASERPSARKLSSAAIPPPSMAAQTPDPDSQRRTQRRRAVIAWVTALAALALVAIVVIAGGSSGSSGSSSADIKAEHNRIAKIPYGETMKSTQFKALDEGEGEADVLAGLDATGRPESRTLPYVLVLFPPPAKSEFCTYWEFSDEPEVFARLCFSHDDGTLTSKLAGNVHGAAKGQGTVI